MSEEVKDKNDFSKGSYDISEIEKEVDKIVLKNKPIESFSKEVDFESISLKSRNGKHFYYLKKKSDKKIKTEEKLSKKISETAKTNLGEKPSKKQEKTKKERPKEKIDKTKQKPTTKDYNNISKDVDKLLENDGLIEIIKGSKKVSETNVKISESSKKPVTAHKKPYNIFSRPDIELKSHPKRHIRFSTKRKKETSKVKPKNKKIEETAIKKPSGETRKHIRIKIGKKKDVLDKKDKIEKSIKTKSEETEKKEIKPATSEIPAKKKDEDIQFVDHKIEEILIKPIDVKTPENNVPNIEKKSLFKNRKSFKIKDKTIEKPTPETTAKPTAFGDKDTKIIEKKLKNKPLKETKIDKVKEKKERKFLFKNKKKVETKAEELPTKTDESPQMIKFRVENHPGKNIIEDFKKIDKNIEEAPEVQLLDESTDKTEIKAKNFVKEHIKDKPTLDQQEPEKDDKKADFEDKPSLSFNEEDMGHEHVFFNEHEYASFEGWSPHISDKERKELALPVSPKSELSPNDLALVKDIELPKEVLSKSVKLSDLGFSENDWEELDFYPLVEPYSYVEILREKDTLEKCYFLVEVEITEKELEILDFIKETIHNYSFSTEDFEIKNQGDYLVNVMDEIIKEYNLRITEESKNKLVYHLSKSSLGLGKLEPLMRDPNIEDISCDGAGVPLFLYHRKYGSLKSNVTFNTEDELSSFIYRLAQKCGKHISIAEPMLDATMPDGSRIQMTLSDEITAKGSTFTIRKFKDDPFSPPDLYEYNTMSSEMISYLWVAIENGVNTLFAGGTASGKTTALNAVSLFIPAESKIVTIEETRELNLPHTNWIPGVARTGFGPVIADKMQGEIDLYDLMKAALRQRPEYILVGEIRGREAYVLFQAMATGHATYSTVHADSAQSLIHRLEGKPINIPRVMLQSLDIISLHVITRVKNTRARRCKQIIEIIDIDPTTKEILTNEVFRWDPIEDNFVYSGKSYVLERIRAEKDLSREEMTQEIKKRQQIIEWMNRNNIREFKEVANIVTRYAENPNEVLEQMKKDTEKDK